MSIRFCCLMVVLSSSISLLVFYLVVLSVAESRVLKLSTIIVFSLFLLSALLDWLHVHFSLGLWVIAFQNCYVFLVDWLFDHYIMSLSICGDFLCFEVYFIWYWYNYSCFPENEVCIICNFLSFYFQFDCIINLMWVCCKQCIVESVFLIHSLNWCIYTT